MKINFPILHKCNFNFIENLEFIYSEVAYYKSNRIKEKIVNYLLTLKNTKVYVLKIIHFIGLSSILDIIDNFISS